MNNQGDRYLGDKYEIFGGDHGNYTISLEGNATPVAFVRRNQKGGGYTVSRADESRSVSMRSMPTADNGHEQAAAIMALLMAEFMALVDAKCSTVDTLVMYLDIHEALDAESPDEMARLLSVLYSKLSKKFFEDTGVKVGSALGWDKPKLETDKGTDT
tara:strand:- start:343 stop:816 length:474 start_codon:yes stop_codon:yes gene_type:complete